MTWGPGIEPQYPPLQGESVGNWRANGVDGQEVPVEKVRSADRPNRPAGRHVQLPLDDRPALVVLAFAPAQSQLYLGNVILDVEAEGHQSKPFLRNGAG